MTYAEFINRVAEFDVFESKAQARRTIEDIKLIIQDELVAGRPLSLGTNFGSFKPIVRAAKNGRNPRTGEALKIPSTNAVKFSVSAPLKRAINQ